MVDFEKEKELTTGELLLLGVGLFFEGKRLYKDNKDQVKEFGKESLGELQSHPESWRDILKKFLSETAGGAVENETKREQERIKIKAEAVNSFAKLESLLHELADLRTEAQAFSVASAEQHSTFTPPPPVDPALIQEKMHDWTKRIKEKTAAMKEENKNKNGSFFSDLFKK